jgi:PTH2 family peptidyl-tRNA hydrolase
MDLKQVILVRQDLRLPKGKLAAQVAHGAVEAYRQTLNNNKDKAKDWISKGMKKVVLKVKDKEELFKFKELAKQEGLVAVIITDAGKTVVAPGTPTVLAIGPDDESNIDNLTGDLGML